MSWNGSGINRPQWNGNGGAVVKAKNISVSTLTADEITTKNLYADFISTNYLQSRSISSLNGSIGFLSNLVINTGVIGLGPTPTYLTANDGILYVNGDAVAFPSSLSTIADWSFFPAAADVNMGFSTLYNVKAISTNFISSGIANIGSASIKNIFGSTITITDNFTGNKLFTNTISTNTISNDVSRTNTIREVKTISLSRSITTQTWSATKLYGPLEIVFYQDKYYQAIITNLNTNPADVLEEWVNGQSYVVGDTVFLTGVGSYSCLIDNSFVTSPNNNLGYWVAIGATNSPTNVWTEIFPEETSGYITGNTKSYIQVGRISTLSMTTSSIKTNGFLANQLFTSSINANSISTISISTSSIETNAILANQLFTSSINANSISTSIITANSISTNTFNASSINAGIFNTSNIVSYNITNSNLLSNAGDAQLNTLTTGGTLNTNGALAVYNSINFSSDGNNNINGGTTQNGSPLGTQTRFYNSLNNFLNVNTNAVNIYGCGTGNEFIPPFRNYSVLNVGENEFAPATVVFNGLNPDPIDPLTNATTALIVRGDTSLTGNTSFYPLNGSLTAYSAYGNAYVYGTFTTTGLLTSQGTALFEGVVNTLGDANVGGVATVTGIGTFLGGVAITGLLTAQNSEINFNNNVGGSAYTFTNWGGTVLKNGLTLTGDGVAQNNFTVGGSLGVGDTCSVTGDLVVNGLIYGTVVSGSETVSTLNVSTLRAFNISSITNTTQELFVSSIGGYSNRTIKFNNLINANNISTNHIDVVGSLSGITPTDSGIFFSRSNADIPLGAIGCETSNQFSIIGIDNTSIRSFNNLEIGSLSSNIRLVTPFGSTEISDGLDGGQLNVPFVSSLSMTTANLAIKPYSDEGDGFASFYQLGDDEVPRGAIGASSDALFILGLSSMNIRAFENLVIESGNEMAFVTPSTLTIDAYNINNIGGPILTSSIGATYLQSERISTVSLYASEVYTDYLGNPNTFDVLPIKVNNPLDLQANSIYNVNNISTTSVYANQLYTTFLGNPYPFAQLPIKLNNALDLQANSIYNVAQVSTGSLLAGSVGTPSVSTNNISTGSLFARSTFTSVIQPSLDAGPLSNIVRIQGNLSTLNQQVSSLTANILTTSNIATRRISKPADMGGQVPTVDLEPATGNSTQLGYPFAGNFNGFFSRVCTVSTITSNIVHPLGGIASTIRILGTVSTQNVTTSNIFVTKIQPYNTTRVEANYIHSEGNVGNSAIGSLGRFYNEGYFSNVSSQSLIVSTINRKQYCYTSTFGVLNSASTFRFNGTDAVVPQILYSNIAFPHIGTYLVSGKNSLSKASGGTGAEPHGFFSLSRGLYASTFSVEDGFSSLPFMNRNNVSTLNTFTSEIYVSSMNTNTRFITYTDYSAHSYVMDFGLGQLRATYIPRQGLLPE